MQRPGTRLHCSADSDHSLPGCATRLAQKRQHCNARPKQQTRPPITPRTVALLNRWSLCPNAGFENQKTTENHFHAECTRGKISDRAVGPQLPLLHQSMEIQQPSFLRLLYCYDHNYYYFTAAAATAATYTECHAWCPMGHPLASPHCCKQYCDKADAMEIHEM